MAGRSSRNKGANAERELADIIYYATGVKMLRNLDQTRSGGHDLDGIDGLSIEVKRQEKLCLPAWWRQTLQQAAECDNIPVLAYRQNRQSWQFIVGLDKIELNKEKFIQWIQDYARMNQII